MTGRGIQKIMNIEAPPQGVVLWHSELLFQGNQILFCWFIEAAGRNRMITQFSGINS
jgi:hypothetical protein